MGVGDSVILKFLPAVALTAMNKILQECFHGQSLVPVLARAAEHHGLSITPSHEEEARTSTISRFPPSVPHSSGEPQLGTSLIKRFEDKRKKQGKPTVWTCSGWAWSAHALPVLVGSVCYPAGRLELKAKRIQSTGKNFKSPKKVEFWSEPFVRIYPECGTSGPIRTAITPQPNTHLDSRTEGDRR